ncbi:hypothetical protein D3C86_2042260 [compost metagenome]
MAQVMINSSPIAVTRCAPIRLMIAPVTKLGANIATTCHWMAPAASVGEWPHRCTMASGAATMIRVIRA